MAVENIGDEVFVVADGVKVAKRGKSNQAETWIPIEPGWSVAQIGDEIHVTHEVASIH